MEQNRFIQRKDTRRTSEKILPPAGFELGKKSSCAKISDRSEDKSLQQVKKSLGFAKYQFEKTFDTETVQHASIYLLFAYKNKAVRQFDYVLINLSR